MTGTADKADIRFALVLLWAFWYPIAFISLVWIVAAISYSVEEAKELFARDGAYDFEAFVYDVMFYCRLYCIGIVSALACVGSLARQQGNPISVIASYVMTAPVSFFTMTIDFDLTWTTLILIDDIAEHIVGFILAAMPFLLPWLLWKNLHNLRRYDKSSTAGRFMLLMLWALWCPVAMWAIDDSARVMERVGKHYFEVDGFKYLIMFYCIGIVSALACDGSLARQQGRPIRVIASYVFVVLVSLHTTFFGLLFAVVGGVNIIVVFILGVMPFLFPWLLWNTLPNPGRSMF